MRSCTEHLSDVHCDALISRRAFSSNTRIALNHNLQFVVLFCAPLYTSIPRTHLQVQINVSFARKPFESEARRLHLALFIAQVRNGSFVAHSPYLGARRPPVGRSASSRIDRASQNSRSTTIRSHSQLARTRSCCCIHLAASRPPYALSSVACPPASLLSARSAVMPSSRISPSFHVCSDT